MKYLLLLISFITKVYSLNQNIIVLPMKKGVFAHIKTNDSFINFYSKTYEFHIWNEYTLYSDRYVFEVGKNLTNLNLRVQDKIKLLRVTMFFSKY